jgi:hypothetical protein
MTHKRCAIPKPWPMIHVGWMQRSYAASNISGQTVFLATCPYLS